MKGMVRVTVTVPAKLLQALDEKLTLEDESRSAVFRRLVENALREAQEREDVERWIQGYVEQPQTEEEFGWLDGAVLEFLKSGEWEWEEPDETR